MATASLQLAAQILPHLRANVLAGHVRTYGHYAEAIGRDGAREGVAMGGPMHIIGAACAMARIPIIPLHYVERADREYRQIFESSASESIHVAPQWDLLMVSARVYRYEPGDFDKLETLVLDRFERFVAPEWQTPQRLWQFLIHHKMDGGLTVLERALRRYEEIVAAERRRRATGG